MKFFNFDRKRKPERVTDSWPINPGGLKSTYGELRFHAQNIADGEWRTPAEQGMAIAILALLDDAERRAA